MAVFTSTPPGKQRFSIPENIVHYIMKNPTSYQIWKKLIQVCKYFFSKNPIVVVDSLWRVYGSTFNWDVCLFYYGRKNIDIENISFKLWIISDLDAVNYYPQAYLDLPIQKIYRSELTKLRLQNVSLSYNEFKFLTSSDTINQMKLVRVLIQHNDGSSLSYDEILQLVPSVKHVFFGFCPHLTSPMEFNNRADHVCEVEYITLDNVPEGFDIETFTAFMKNHPRTAFQLYYSVSIDSEEYIAKLQHLANTIIAEGKAFGPIIYFKFPKLDSNQLAAINKLANQRMDDEDKQFKDL